MPDSSSVLIDYQRYPIDQGGSKREALLERVRSDLARDGCAVSTKQLVVLLGGGTHANVSTT